jgi:hypothetical protein
MILQLPLAARKFNLYALKRKSAEMIRALAEAARNTRIATEENE